MPKPSVPPQPKAKAQAEAEAAAGMPSSSVPLQPDPASAEAKMAAAMPKPSVPASAAAKTAAGMPKSSAPASSGSTGSSTLDGCDFGQLRALGYTHVSIAGIMYEWCPFSGTYLEAAPGTYEAACAEAETAAGMPNSSVQPQPILAIEDWNHFSSVPPQLDGDHNPKSSVPSQLDADHSSASAEAETAASGSTEAKQEKVPLRAVKFFRKVIRPKLDKGEAVDMDSYFTYWAPQRLKSIKKAFHNTTYEALKADSRDISAHYDGISLQASVENRPKEKLVRIMLKVSTSPNKMCQGGSYAFPTLPTGKVTKKAYLYMDMLRILTMICGHKKADLALIKECHTSVKTYLDFMVA
jgi:hypothetical protein